MTTLASRFNKHAFFADLGYTPHTGQIEVHASPASRRVVACGVRWGKTLCAAMEGLAAAMLPAESVNGLGGRADLRSCRQGLSRDSSSSLAGA